MLVEIIASQSLLGDLHQPKLGEIMLFSVLFLSSVIGWMSLKPLIISRKDFQKEKSKRLKLISNREIFDVLLFGSRKLSSNPDGLGIFLKGENSKYHVLKVCNPFCGPCAKTHPILEELFESENIDLQIIFHPGGEDAIKQKTISHLVAIAAAGSQEDTKAALDDWYQPEEKDYEAFAAKYPMSEEMKAQQTHIKAMLNWCEQENISYTPTIFINGYELPKAYVVEDLKYILL